MENINTSEYWDSVYKQEGMNSWRNYPITWSFIEQHIHKDSRVLEIGSGDGQFAEMIKDRCSDYIGVDLSEIACSYAVRRTGMTFFALSAEEYVNRTLPMCSGKNKLFDVIVLSQTFEHIENPESLLKGLLIMSDSVIIAVPDNQLQPYECKEHLFDYTMDRLQSLLSKFYKDVKITRITDSIVSPDGLLSPISLVAVAKN